MRLFFLTIILFFSITAFPQKETSNWYLGDSVLLHFTDKGIINEKTNLSSTEGCAAISDKYGKLLFWGTPEKTLSFTNKSYKTIGNESSTQGIIFLKHPNNDSLIFSLTSTGATPYFNSKLAFHIYKTNGDSVRLNKILQNSTTEKLHGCNHQNNKDIWIATHDSKSDSFIFYLVKKEGIVCCPLYQRIGYNFSSGDFPHYNGAGQMKFSPNGKYISTGILEPQEVELFLFNNENGKIIENSKINIVIDLPRGLEYDCNSDFLFISANNSLHQYSLKNHLQSKVLNSHKIIATYDKFGAAPLQLASNSKIYLADNDSISIASINRKTGDTFEFKEKDIILNKGKCLLGLPSFNASYFYTPSIDYAYEQDCRTNTIAFEGKDTIKATSYKWVFSKGTKTDTKATKDVSYTFSDTGKWQVKYIANNGNRSDTVTKTITIRPKLEQGFLGEDIRLCKALPLKLNAPKNLHCIHWYNDTFLEIGKVDSIKITKPGKYYAKATNLSFCVEWDTIRIDTAITKPKANYKANDVCEDSTTYFTNLSKNAETWHWKFGDGVISNIQNPFHKYSIGGVTKTFNAKLINLFRGGCTDSISKQITINAKPKKGFIYTKSGQLVIFNAKENNASKYTWTLGDGGNDTVTNNPKTIHSYSKFPSGKYTACLKVTNLAECVADTCIEIQISGSIPSLALQNEIIIYPNPSKGKITIEINNSGTFTIKVYNAMGQVILTKTVKGNQPNTLFLNQPKGNYIIEILDDENNRVLKNLLVE